MIIIMKGLISRFGSIFLLFLALYQISLSTKCHHMVLVQEQAAAVAQEGGVSHYNQHQHHIMSIPRGIVDNSRSTIFDDEESSATATTTRRRTISRQTQTRRIPLYDLVDTKIETSCINKNLVLVNDTRFYPSPLPLLLKDDNETRKRRIPRIIHVTSKSRCMTRAFAENLELWKRTFPNYIFVLHNDEAMNHFLLDSSYAKEEFPHLSQIASACLNTAAGKADLWRALILYEYGGIYTDIDNAPGKALVLMNNATSNSSIIIGSENDNDNNDNDLTPHNEAFFVVENEGMLSQYFMASTPRHALLYMLIQITLHRVLSVPSVDNQYVPFVTGPGALKAAFIEFMQAQHLQPASKNSQQQQDKNNNKYDLYQKVRAGRYTGLFNWTVTVVGSARTGSQEYVQRNVIYQKRRIYQEMDMIHFSRIHSSQNQKGGATADYRNESCIQRMYRLGQQQGATAQ